jgi:hypothetical protein
MVRTVEPGGGPRFQGPVGASGMLERKTLIDVNAHLP